MLDAGGGGGGTPWESMTLQAMQTLIQNPDTEKHWNLVNGWTKSADLINEHRFQVQNYRDNLAAAWPPERSAASAAYLARLDALIASLSETYEAAVANHDAFSTATLSLSLAQTDMQKIFDEYQANEQLLLDFKTTQEAKQNSGTPQPTPSPSGEQPPVAPDRQEQLRQKAVTLLQGVSTELAQAQVRLVKPKLYANGFNDDSLPNDGQTFVAPPIPPIVPNFASGNSVGNHSRRPAAPFPSNFNSTPSITTPSAVGNQPGLILGGTNTPSITPPSTGIAPPPALPSSPPSPITNPSPLLPPSRMINPLSNGGTTGVGPPPATSIGRGLLPPREGIARPGASGSGALHVMPPGGIIGGAPGTGLGQPGTGRPTTRRVNPVGGIIGENTAPRPTPGRGFVPGEHGTFAPYGQTGGRRPGHQDQSGMPRWDPDNPWQTAEGVDPIVRPSREQRIDPGPAIGLH